MRNGVEDDHMAVTDELFELLGNFKKNSYPGKEMDILFWELKAKGCHSLHYKDFVSIKVGKKDKGSKSAAYAHNAICLEAAQQQKKEIK